jgi:hypothetical protein
MTGNKAILPKNIVDKWILEVMKHQYDITIHANESPFPEMYVRSVSSIAGCSSQLVNDNKIVVSSHDPVALAHVALLAKRKGYLVEE